MRLPGRIVLGVCGGIAAYKTPHLVRLLRKEGSDIRVVLTPYAREFVGIEALRTVSGYPVYLDRMPGNTRAGDSPPERVEHVGLGQWGDTFLVCPATANTLAKFSLGIADNLLTTTALCFDPSTLVVAPAMNTAMWLHPATRHHIDVLRQRGVRVLPVEEGELACGEAGPGRMLSPEAIVEELRDGVPRGPFRGKRILISSGPTVEPIDPVRMLTNRSSGRMGAALAEAAGAMGADVTLVSGPSIAPPPPGVRLVRVTTAREMKDALLKEFPSHQYCLMAAAVADYRPKDPADEKIRRDPSAALTLRLVANPDILALLGERKEGRFLVGFALESSSDLERAREKMRRKGCDMMICNSVEGALERDDTQVTILYADGASTRLEPMDKRRAAREILIRVARQSGPPDG